ncbi:helix-turn-helix domain-containing protein [Clostridium cochlearium]|uniref:DNA binding domain, excisionase family n=1 Tax=Clostridium cochlearium TaxID=1494 RepID=A0A2X2VWZ5_CLOCO|nr:MULTISPECIES: helix-turn-helix domain-containing protein [Clostridium]MBE6057652.1 DNA-binding protein [Clostridium sp.]MDU1442078.1 helix-turn-helix domain-containing protein [Clostridium cochlearium]NME94565.1 helix-turn-helix domain-containing protein [Clostridium cochlearium]SQB35482.1 DNA binding domain, excisionase family [Clostridium cochlearium]
MVNITKMVEEHRKDIAKKTLTIKELAQVLGLSENKARQLTHAKDFPVLVLGRTRLTIISKLDEWLEENIGEIL